MSSEDGTAAQQTGVAKKAAKSEVGKELAKLKFEMKNQSMPKLPPNMTVERRPLMHAPIASPFAGAGVQKVVYVSCNTPIMAAVKRVKKLLSHVEKRAMQGVDLISDRNGTTKLAEANAKLAESGEAVLVRASGRAMQQALRVGQWFRNREDELACNVDVRTGSVQAVDDIVEKQGDVSIAGEQPQDLIDTSAMGITDTSIITATHIETSTPAEPHEPAGPVQKEAGEVQASTASAAGNGEIPKKRRRRGKRQKAVLDEETTARLRWVKTVELAISLKG